MSLPPPAVPWAQNTLAHALHPTPGRAAARQGAAAVVECLGSAPSAHSGAGAAAPHSPPGPRGSAEAVGAG